MSSSFPREPGYTLTIGAPEPRHPVLVRPNIVTPGDIDSLSQRARRLVRGSRNARAILAGNLQRPDSSAAILRDPTGAGAIWYVAFPVARRAAAGYEAEQKLLANLLSFREGRE